jgi:hypothetical protein
MKSTFLRPGIDVLVAAAIALNTLVVALAIVNWNKTADATSQPHRGDPAGLLAGALNFAQSPLFVLGMLVIAGEWIATAAYARNPHEV